RFEAFAATRVRGAVLDALRCLDWLPRAFRRRQGKLRQACEALTKEIGRPPTSAELCERLGWTVDEIREHIDRSQLTFIGSLDEPLRRESEESRKAGVPDADAADPLYSAIQADQRRQLHRAIRGLSERGQSVLRAYYFENLTLKEIAQKLGV